MREQIVRRLSKRGGVVLMVVFAISVLLGQQPRSRPAPAPKRPVREARPTTEQLAAAAVDKFLKGVKLADLAEGKAMLAETQWITGYADYGANFYSRPVYTDVKTLFEGMFDTDVPGVRGYKRLMEMDAVSEAKMPLKIRFIAIAYADRSSGQWKVLGTGTDGSVDVERNVAYFEKNLNDTRYSSEQENYLSYGHWLLKAGRIRASNDTRYSSEQENYLSYGHWLLKAGRIRASKEALLRARDANPFSSSDSSGTIGGKYVPLHKAQIQALIEVIDRIAPM